jgi:hypothetical protein
VTNIYCDESCHLENDDAQAMLLGAMSCSARDKDRIYKTIRDIKVKYGLSSRCEIKWTGVSPSKLAFYLELIDTFYEEKYLSFRAVVIKNKTSLNHEKYNNGDHDVWYNKAYYYLLDPFIQIGDRYNVFIDVKDTCGGPRISMLKNVLSNKRHDFNQDIIKGIYQIRSHESEILQLTDLIIGAVGYYHNGRYGASGSSNAKNEVLNRLLEYYGKRIVDGSARGTEKVDIFLWELKE